MYARACTRVRGPRAWRMCAYTLRAVQTRARVSCVQARARANARAAVDRMGGAIARFLSCLCCRSRTLATVVCSECGAPRAGSRRAAADYRLRCADASGVADGAAASEAGERERERELELEAETEGGWARHAVPRADGHHERQRERDLRHALRRAAGGGGVGGVPAGLALPPGCVLAVLSAPRAGDPATWIDCTRRLPPYHAAQHVYESPLGAHTRQPPASFLPKSPARYHGLGGAAAAALAASLAPPLSRAASAASITTSSAPSPSLSLSQSKSQSQPLSGSVTPASREQRRAQAHAQTQAQAHAFGFGPEFGFGIEPGIGSGIGTGTGTGPSPSPSPSVTPSFAQRKLIRAAAGIGSALALAPPTRERATI